MNDHCFWRGLKYLNVQNETSTFEKAAKICLIDSSLFVLSVNSNIYRAHLDNTTEFLEFVRIPNICAIDIATDNSKLYIVDTHGQVFKCDPIHCDHKQEILIKEDAECCLHGHKTPSRKVRIKSIFANMYGILYISECGQLWASGCMPQISVDTQTPVRVVFFEGRSVYHAAVGENFAIAVVRKSICDDDIESENEDVFFTSCGECRLVSKLSSPASQLSLAETCPLGIMISKSSEDTSSASVIRDGHTKNHNNIEDSSSSTEDSELTKIHFDECKKQIVTEKTEIQKEKKDLTLSNFAKPDSEKQNVIFINTEAAKQFLSRQLSWVSASEDYLVECTEKPTRIIKENVSNLTNLVVEGVKTVGDKVATLSRHMSGSSETNEVVKSNENMILDEINPMLHSLTSMCKVDDLQMSSSTVSDKEYSNNVINKANIIMKTGQNLLNSEIWVWGNINHGQLGTGDTIKRMQPILVSRLTGLGIHRVSCGKSHCAALTLDGRVFLWGKNNWHQVCTNEKEDKSSPQQFTANTNADRIKDMVCGDNHSLFFTLNRNIFFQGYFGDGCTKDVVKLHENIKTIKESELNSNSCERNNIFNTQIKKHKDFYSYLSYNLNLNNRLMSSQNIIYFYNFPRENNESPILQDLAIEQQFLEETTVVHQLLIKPFLKKTSLLGPDSKYYEKLCNSYADIMYFTATNVLSFWKYTDFNKKVIEITLIQNSDEHISIYRTYMNCICDILSMGGFYQISSQVDIPNIIQNMFGDKLPSSIKKNTKKISEAIISCALVHPLSRLNTYKCIIQSVMRHNSMDAQKLLEVLGKWDTFIDEQEKKRKEAEATKLFWESHGKTIDSFRSPSRRLIYESRSHPLSLFHSGRFSSHWFVLLNDILIHVNGNTQITHNLSTLWVEPVTDSDVMQNALQLITPEEVLTVTTPSSQEKNEWLQILQSTIKLYLNKHRNSQPPLVRTADYAFTSKSQLYKEAKYSGRWLNGKMHGAGKIEWPDGKNYYGQFHNNQIHGYGKMEIPSIGTYEGQWKDNLQNGFGTMKYCSGDVYEGYFKDGLAHGYGVRKQGDFTSATATIYMGDWAQGVRHGYGVMDDIGKGEKYLGNWIDNKKHGCGLIVTLDGIYYEGVFTNDVLTGHGVMIFEDGTHYEGEFKSAGVFSGKGTLTFSSGDKIDGTLNGAWTDGVKISYGILQMNVSNPISSLNSKPNSFGKLCVLPNQKWNGLFHQCFQQMGVPDNVLTPMGNHVLNTYPIICNKKIWQNIAVSISKANSDKSMGYITESISKFSNNVKEEDLNVIPVFGQTSLTLESYIEVKTYLNKACETPTHPLGRLIAGCCAAFCTSYGGVRVHPLLLSHAVAELKCIAIRLYTVIRILFPSLPIPTEYVVLHEDSNCNDSDDLDGGEVVTVSTVIQPFLLPRVHSSLHVLYALHHQREDEAYWKRLLKWNRQTDITLMAFLGIDQKFWLNYTLKSPSPLETSPIKEQLFTEAVDTLQQLKTTFSPMEKLFVIKNTFQQMTLVVQKELGKNYLWTMDEIFPLFHFIVVRARILQLGSEIHFIEDFLEPCMQNGELGIMFTTLKACYYQILQEKATICD